MDFDFFFFYPTKVTNFFIVTREKFIFIRKIQLFSNSFLNNFSYFRLEYVFIHNYCDFARNYIFLLSKTRNETNNDFVLGL